MVGASADVQVKRLEDKDQILSILQGDRLYAAYAIGDLDPGMFGKCEWAAAYDGSTAKSLCLLFKGLTPNALFCLGEPAGLAVILGSAMRPGRVFFAAKHTHLPTIRAFYDLEAVESLMRMALTAAEFQPAGGHATLLSSRDMYDLNDLYRLGGGSGFAPYQVTQGIFYGVYADGQLAATAGTHVIAPELGIACVGNVFTHPGYRGRGFARVCTSAVVRDVLAKGCRDVVLNVRQDNSPALRAYRRLGFAEHSAFAEVYGTRKGSWRALLTRLWTG